MLRSPIPPPVIVVLLQGLGGADGRMAAVSDTIGRTLRFVSGVSLLVSHAARPKRIPKLRVPTAVSDL
ncbi:MAG: hypothetical protein M3365_05170 [Gemmatimonadota bacterium]|nr:hypothetical protein [Gemmatimonadota bacterium]